MKCRCFISKSLSLISAAMTLKNLGKFLAEIAKDSAQKNVGVLNARLSELRIASSNDKGVIESKALTATSFNSTQC